MKLAFNLFNNPIADSTSALFRSLTRYQFADASFSTIADGGFSDCSFTLADATDAMIDEALAVWLGKRICITDGAGVIAWEGYVSEVQATRGYQTLTRSLDAFCNRVFVSYTYSGGTCPRGGTCVGREQRNETDVDATANTQDTIGIKEEWLDITDSGLMTSGQAQRVGNRYLRKSVRPREWEMNLSSGAERQTRQLTITGLGYYATLQWRKLTRKWNVATNIQTIISDIVTSGKCPFLDTANLRTETTGITKQYNTEGAPIWIQDMIREVIADGNSSGARLLFQVIENRVPVLSSVATTTKYYARRDDPRLFNADRKPLPAYLIRAGGFILAEDVAALTESPTDIANNARASFVNETEYDCMTDTLHIPAPSSELVSVERLLTSVRKGRRKRA